MCDKWRSAVAALSATALLVCAAPAHAVSSAQIVAVINVERHANGLPPVREDPSLSTGCAQYDNYRRINGSLENAFTLHGEEATKSGYTPAGARAAHDSILNAGDRRADSFAAGDVFDDAPNHLVALMDPAVAVIGADQTDFEFGLFGTVSLSCVDIRSAPPRAKPRHVRVYGYIGPRGKAPRNPVYREGPSGNGTFVFLYFDAPRGAHLALRKLRVRRHDGKIASPTFVAVSGMKDGRHGAHSAISKFVSKVPTPVVWVRIDEREAAEERTEFEEDLEYERFRDELEWGYVEELGKPYPAVAEKLGLTPVPFR